jgi:putative acetyltransferase
MEHDTNPAGAGFLIRPVTEDDNDVLAGLLRDVMEEFGATGAGSSLHDPEMLDMASAYASGRSAYFVIESTGGLVGGGGLGPLAGGESDVCELRKMYLRPAARGRGLGRAMLTRCLDVARQLGYKRIYLETRQTMREARRLYERNGFVPVGKPIGHTGHFGCDAWYVRDL